jgi:acid phosphatase type 7
VSIPPSPSGAISRRDLLRAAGRAAGGVTFLALVPTGWRHFPFALPGLPPDGTPARARRGSDRPLLFTALPYIQPGPAGSLEPGRESIVVAWQTEDRVGSFGAEFGLTRAYGRHAKVTATSRDGGGGRPPADSAGPPATDDHAGGGRRRNYAAMMTGLALDTRYHYRVHEDGRSVVEGYFTTRRPRQTPIRFVAFGDNSFGSPGQRAVAWQAYEARPDFVMNTGDNVYQNGLDTEYARYFFPVYNADLGGPRTGAPLLRSVPFYTVLGNHDVYSVDATGQPAANFDVAPDALAFYTNLYLPLTGPATPPQAPSVIAKAAGASAFDRFRDCAGARFPRMGNYSFDYGDAHFLCLDSNLYVDPTDSAWHDFVEQDLGETDAAWKFVVYHHSAFNVGNLMYTQQHMRVLSPLLERMGVDMVLAGHEHNYQRTRPFTFVPHGPGEAARRGAIERLVPGTFTIDTVFDGTSETRPRGIIYVTTGAGGSDMFDPDFNVNPSLWVHAEDDRTSYAVRVVTDRHSFTVIDLDARTLTLRQIDETGTEIDRIRIDK